jgi:hypothetical protein
MISRELNQSSSWPRSSIIWNAPAASPSIAKPYQENVSCGRGVVSRMNSVMPMMARIPNGRLT